MAIQNLPSTTRVAPSPPDNQKIPELSTEERVGQLFVWGIADTDTLSSASAELIKTTHPAGVLLTGTFTTESLTKLTGEIKQIDIKIPLFIAMDEEGGTVRHITDDTFPGGRLLGMEPDDAFCAAIASRSALLTRAGINANFGIIGDIGWNEQYGYMYPRTYSDTPDEVTKRVHEAVYCSGNSITVIKHFPGHGSTTTNSHYQIPVIAKDASTWMQEDGMPFFQAVKDGVDIIMVGHLIYENIATEPASLSKPIHELLEKANFQGITITDDLGMLEQAGYTATESIKQAIVAGNNVVLISTTMNDPHHLYETLLSEATASPSLMQQIMDQTDKTIELKARRL